MSGPTGQSKVYETYGYVVLLAGGASALIAWIALSRLANITDSGMWAIAAMVFAPSALGVGAAAFIHQTHLAELRLRGPERPGSDGGSSGQFFSREERRDG